MNTRTRVAAAALAGLVVVSGAAPVSAAVRSDQPRLGPGDHGTDVRALQLKLRRLRFDPGPITGVYGTDTVYAVWAFQKAHGIRANRSVTPRTWRALARPGTMRRLVRHAPGRRAEVDLRRQLLVLYAGGRVRLVSHVSTGTGRRYCAGGRCGVARTPRGDFTVFRKIRRWRRSRLGWMYRPSYFVGGYAIHGSPNVPAHRASHGCVRVPMDLADTVGAAIRMGERVYVR
ncbi:MAG TPA: L,D-transpeptidase family protein [Streptosporangiaceae bacterium]